MNNQSRFVLAMVSSLSFVPVLGCNGPDDDPVAPVTAGQVAPEAAAGPLRDVYTYWHDASGQQQSHREQFTEPQWQAILEHRRSSCSADNKVGGGNKDTFVARHAQTVTASCSACATTILTSGHDGAGTVACLAYSSPDNNDTYDVGFMVQYVDRSNTDKTLVCTSATDCLYYECSPPEGRGVWVSYQACSSCGGCTGNLWFTPSNLTKVHMQHGLVAC